MPAPRNLLLVDDHPIIVVAVRALIESRLTEYSLHSAATRTEASEMARAIRPSLAIVDLSLADGDGMDVIRDLREEVPECQSLVFSMQDELRFGPRALRYGARGYLMKGSRISALFDAIQVIESGRLYCSEELREALLMNIVPKAGRLPGVEGLSDREFQVFQLVGQGLTSKDIAARLAISPKTVDSHRENMKVKLNCSSGMELAFQARDWFLHDAMKNDKPPR